MFFEKSTIVMVKSYEFFWEVVRKGLILAIVAISISLTSVTAFQDAFAQTTTDPVTGEKTYTVRISDNKYGCEDSDLCFLPWRVTLEVGDKVKWMSLGSESHKIVQDRNEWSTKLIGGNQVSEPIQFNISAKESGYKYESYHCQIHPWYEGIIVVNEKSPVTTKPENSKIVNSNSDSNSENKEIPSWIKNNAGWWADGTIDDSAFIQGIQFLIKEGVLDMKNANDDSKSIQTTVVQKPIAKKSYLNHVYENRNGLKAYSTLLKWSIIPSDTNNFFKVVVKGDVKLSQELKKSEGLFYDLEIFNLMLDGEKYPLKLKTHYNDNPYSSGIEFDWKSQVNESQELILTTEMKGIDQFTTIEIFAGKTKLGLLNDLTFEDVCTSNNKYELCSDFYSVNKIEFKTGKTIDLLLIDLKENKKNSLRELTVKTESGTSTFDTRDLSSLDIYEVRGQGLIELNDCEGVSGLAIIDCVKENYSKINKVCSSKSTNGVGYCFLVEKSDVNFRIYNENTVSLGETNRYNDFSLIFSRDSIK